MPIAQFSGLASGIDSQSLIDSLIAARQVKNDIRKKEISDLETESETLTEFKGKLQALNDIIEKFRTINGGGLAKKATSSNEDAVTAVASSAALNASYAVTVTSVADTANGSFNRSYASDTDSVADGSGQNITVTVGTGADEVIISTALSTLTLAEFVSNFNSNPLASGRVTASAVNIGTTTTPDYRLVFTTLESGTEKGSLSLSSTFIGDNTTTIEQATDAEFSIGGIASSITRSSNTISDIIGGLTFSLVDVGTSTISVGNDPETTATQIEEFVTAYNEVVEYINENNQIERVLSNGQYENVFSPLAKVRTDNDFLSSFRTAISSANASSGTSVKIFAELGLTTNRFDGTLTFNKSDAATANFLEAVANDPEGVTGVLNSFADTVAGFTGTIYQYTKTGGFIDNSIDSNNAQITNINESIAQLDRQTDKIRDRLTKQFTNLESVTARLQSKQQQLSGILASLQ